MPKVIRAQMLSAIKVIVFTEATYAYLAKNDPQALQQCLRCVTLGDMNDTEASYMGRVRLAYPLNIPREKQWFNETTGFPVGIETTQIDGHWLSHDAKNLWYFWDETLTTCHGPHDSQEEAIASSAEYFKTV